MNNLSVSGAITFLSSLICAFFIFFAPPRNLLKTIWSFFGLTISLWGMGLFFAFLTTEGCVALFWLRFLNTVAVLIPIFFFHFVLIFTEHLQEKKKELFLYYAMVIMFFLATILFPTQFVKSVSFKYPFAFYPDPGLLYYVFPFIFGFLVIYGVILLIKELYSSKNVQKINQIKYFLLGVAIGFGGGSTTFFYVFNINLYPWGAFFVPIHVITVTYAIVKYRLMDIRIAITRGGIFLVVYAFVLGIPFLIGRYTNSWLLTWVFTAIVASVGPSIYRRIQKKAEGLLLAEQKRYQEILIQAADGMANERNLERLLQLIVHVINSAVKIEFTAIFLKDKDGGYRLRAIRDHGGVSVNEVLAENDPVIESVKNKDEKTSELFQSYINKPVGLVLPVRIEDKFTGILVFGEKKNREMYSRGDINVFKILISQASLAIANCLYLEKYLEEKEQRFAEQQDRDAMVMAMSAGVSHQFGNRLNEFVFEQHEITQILNELMGLCAGAEKSVEIADKLKNALKLAGKLGANIGKSKDIINSVIGYQNIITERDKYDIIFIENIVDIATDLLKLNNDLEETPVQMVNIDNKSFYGIKSVIMEVVYGCLQNAYEAIETKRKSAAESYNVLNPAEIILSYSETPQSRVIEIKDNGTGIKEENKNKLFAPFFTTKPSSTPGMGPGLFRMKKMIEEHCRGKLTVESVYGKGTTVKIEIPKGVKEYQ